MTGITRRVDRLEREATGTGRVIVIEGPDGYGTERALTELGVTTADNDLVVYLRNMVERTAQLRLVRISNMAGTR